MDTTTTLVISALPNPAEIDSAHEYLHSVLPLLMAAGGVLVKRVKIEQMLYGRPTHMVLMMDFASADTITAVFGSDTHRALLPARERGFTELNIMVGHEK